ncbi:hypothetical protein FGG08_002882 [Glutinoglossum americanum]|uniref:Uncharacterized protein n=1 Tax=Glutinoglossum americanum TaxID=1670608 RepID=A0A9P8I8C8_9PEZI|nr:hypothetical protein FGG08_002882 [Glutinoglossum americanum]
MDVFYYYTFGTASWLAVQAIPLLASPTLIVAILSPDARHATPLEEYFARSLGIALITMGILAILLTGAIPLTSSFSDYDNNLGTTTDPTDPKTPYAMPALTITTLYHSLMAFYSYTLWLRTGVGMFSVSTGAAGSLAALGVWCILFATSSGRVSGRTGADKRVSGWPFVNKGVDKKKGKKAL